SSAIVLVTLAVIGGLLSQGLTSRHIESSGFLLAGLFGASGLIVQGMVRTCQALDMVRWTSPISPGRALAAHFVFWISLCALPAIALAAAVGSDDGSLSPVDAAVLALWTIATVPTIL